MPRNPEKNAELRETRKKQILEAALSVYIQCGYHGADMDRVAEEAQLAKGLLYYYYKTKNELYAELYRFMIDKTTAFSDLLLENAHDKEPVEQLMYYSCGMFKANCEHPRMIRFFIRAPYDAYAVEGVPSTQILRSAITGILQRGFEQRVIPVFNAGSAANSFWSAYVANLFEYSKLISTLSEKNETGIVREVIRFCFQGLGIDYDKWNACLKKVMAENKDQWPVYEGL